VHDGRRGSGPEPQSGRARQIVDLMAAYASQGATAFEAAQGSEASQVVEEMIAALMGQLEGNLGHVVLWEQFLRTPAEVSEALVGVVEALLCRSAVLNAWMDDAWARYRACIGE
jgi:hypothetical protein